MRYLALLLLAGLFTILVAHPWKPYLAMAQAVPTLTACPFGTAVSTASQSLLPANDLGGGFIRGYLLIQNCGTTGNIWVCVGTNNTCAANKGVLLLPNGATWEPNLPLSTTYPAQWQTKDIAAIASIASGAQVCVCDTP